MHRSGMAIQMTEDTMIVHGKKHAAHHERIDYWLDTAFVFDFTA